MQIIERFCVEGKYSNLSIMVTQWKILWVYSYCVSAGISTYVESESELLKIFVNDKLFITRQKYKNTLQPLTSVISITSVIIGAIKWQRYPHDYIEDYLVKIYITWAHIYDTYSYIYKNILHCFPLTNLHYYELMVGKIILLKIIYNH